MLKAFVDESGIHDGASICVVAGYVGTAAQWQLLDELLALTVPNEVFHAKDFYARRSGGRRVGRYKGWSDERASTHLEHFVRSVETTGVRQIAAAVNVRDFLAMSIEDRRVLTGGEQRRSMVDGVETVEASGGSPKHAYYLAYMQVLIEACQALDAIGDEGPVELVLGVNDHRECPDLC
ncbi:MAG: hypothetical protein ABIQ65_04190 [Thermoanaerobaculia bacterium]